MLCVMAGLSLCLGDTDNLTDFLTGLGHLVGSGWRLSVGVDPILYTDNAASGSRI